VSRLRVDGVDLPLEQEAKFGAGWHALESPAEWRHRWSRGRVPLPPGTRRLQIDLGGPGHYWESTEVKFMFGSALTRAAPLTISRSGTIRIVMRGNHEQQISRRGRVKG
jgi:hypothetical protein